MEEEWREVPSIPGLLASSMGRIMVKPYEASMPRGGSRVYGGKPTYGIYAKDTRRMIYLHKGKTKKVARLVCEAFHGCPPFGKAVCMHIDENSKNNAPSNLKWATQKENLNCPKFLKYCSSRTGENNPRYKGLKKLGEL